MIYSQYEQYELSDRIMRAVCEVGGITFLQLCSTAKTVKLNALRGLYCLISRDYCIHPDRSARLICRTRVNVINQAKKYFPAFICSIMQSILELGINGEYKGISAIVIPSLCDSLKCIGQNWKYAVKDIPFIPMTYPQNRKPENRCASS